ncbi:RNA-binding transcriptional accessory protein [bacterium]|nr:RNA-binding transcriptional accessory protein [bacterium]MCB2179103.1 RNA-binding transcriptional accessory protein [bacterium]
MNLEKNIAAQLNIRPAQVGTTIEMLDAGNTIPFISRYRKERTGSLDEEQIRQISLLAGQLRTLEERRTAILDSIREQEKLTPELESALLSADTLTRLEDLYAPYKPKRRTRASTARERGLEPLAEMILKQEIVSKPLKEIARPYLNEDVPTVEDAWQGARDIVAEQISEQADIRQELRGKAVEWGTLQCEKVVKAEDPKEVYQTYYEFELRVNRLRPHQILAINRGESEKVLRVKVQVPERDWRNAIYAQYIPNRRSPLGEQLELAIEDTAGRLLLPAIERSVRADLTETAEKHAIGVFALNLRALLTTPPLAGHVVLGMDPGYRTGCKLAVVDETGQVLDHDTIYITQSSGAKAAAASTMIGLVKKHKITLVAIGNGTASRETEQFIADLIQAGLPVQYLIASEAGASVYSASPLARAELPDLDVSIRGAVSIARRVQDPLAELVKIEPKAIGVGMYQHDVNQKQLSESLYEVVESVVNQVGVDLGTASPALLTYVAGIGPKLAENIVAYRDANGRFPNRKTLLDVSGLGAKAFEQAAGFLRIRGGDTPLDATAIHPESYKIAKAVLKKAKFSLTDDLPTRKAALDALLTKQPLKEMAAELDCGVPTLRDIFDQLIRPGRDPREDAPTPILRKDVLSMDDLAVGMVLKGTVRNVVDFGSFVDIGVKQDGLLHRSQVPQGTHLQVGNIIDVEILKIETDRGRISLGWAQE